MSHIPFITYVTSPNPDFPLRRGEQIRIANPDGTNDVITLTREITRVSKSRVPPKFLAATSRQYPDSNKRQIGTPWTF